MNPAGFGKYLLNAIVTATAGRAAGILRVELEDAKAEIQEKLKGLGIGAALVAVGAAFAFFATMILLAAAVLALSLVWPAWLAALAVAGVILVVVAILMGIGASKINKNKDLRPEKAINNLRRYFAA